MRNAGVLMLLSDVGGCCYVVAMLFCALLCYSVTT